MITKKIIIGLLIVLMITFVVASQTVQDFPGPFTRHTATDINFTFTPQGGDVGDSANYLFIEALGNGTFFLNRSRDCTNNTLCNLSVSDFVVGRYQWRIQTAENSTNATVTSTNTEPFDMITAETAATMTGGTTELFNLTTNNTLAITYTVDTVEETCSVSFDGLLSDNHTTTTIIQNITAAGCNITGTNTTGNLTLTTTSAGGIDEYINVSGNATNLLGLSTTRVTGTQNGNISLNIDYTINGVSESCAVIFPLSDSNLITVITGNITSVCNLSASNSSGALLLTTKGHGKDELINFSSGNSSNILGLTIGSIVLGTEDNFTSNSSYFDIRSTTAGNLTINLLNDTIIYGDLFLKNPPAACPGGNYMTEFVGNASTCTGSGLTVQINTSSCTRTFTGGLLTAFNGSGC